jgi:predicted metal-dependent hydrolase
MEQITISDITIDVIRKNIKNIHLAVYPPTGRVRLAVPMQLTDDTIRLFVVAKLSWIKRHQRKFKAQDRQLPREYKNRESHYFQGARYLLNVIEKDAPPKVTLRSKTYIDLTIRPNTPVEKRHEIMTEWYRTELKKEIPALIEKWEKVIGVKANDWQVKQMKTKWGTCNITKKRIWLNLELAKKPLQCLEYVIVHEMVHLLERHHNERFKGFMDVFMPHWRAHKEELSRTPISHGEWEY